MVEPNLGSEETEGADTEAYAQRIQRRKAIQDRRMAETVTDRHDLNWLFVRLTVDGPGVRHRTQVGQLSGLGTERMAWIRPSRPSSCEVGHGDAVIKG